MHIEILILSKYSKRLNCAIHLCLRPFSSISDLYLHFIFSYVIPFWKWFFHFENNLWIYEERIIWRVFFYIWQLESILDSDLKKNRLSLKPQENYFDSNGYYGLDDCLPKKNVIIISIIIYIKTPIETFMKILFS